MTTYYSLWHRLGERNMDAWTDLAGLMADGSVQQLRVNEYYAAPWHEVELKGAGRIVEWLHERGLPCSSRRSRVYELAPPPEPIVQPKPARMSKDVYDFYHEMLDKLRHIRDPRVLWAVMAELGRSVEKHLRYHAKSRPEAHITLDATSYAVPDLDALDAGLLMQLLLESFGFRCIPSPRQERVPALLTRVTGSKRQVPHAADGSDNWPAKCRRLASRVVVTAVLLVLGASAAVHIWRLIFVPGTGAPGLVGRGLQMFGALAVLALSLGFLGITLGGTGSQNTPESDVAYVTDMKLIRLLSGDDKAQALLDSFQALPAARRQQLVEELRELALDFVGQRLREEATA